MRGTIVAVLGAVVLSAVTFKGGAAADDCKISDSALCLDDSNCHWDADKRGCEPGPLRAPDACSAHGDKTICESDVSLGCKWSADANKCETKPN